MRYELSKLPLQTLVTPVATATAALVRLDERLNRSDLRQGCISRADFADACASLWIDGELVHLEDLVLHDAGMGIRAPTHELAIAQDVLRTRRRISGHPAGWALSPEGLRNLRGRGGGNDSATLPAPLPEEEALSEPIAEDEDPLARELAEIDAVLARSEAVLSGTIQPSRSSRQERAPLVYEPGWDEDERLEESRAILIETDGLPAALRAALLLDAWNQLQVLQHAPWLGRLLAASLLRKADITIAHLVAVNRGLRNVSRERRTSRDRNTRLLAILDGIGIASELGLKEHDRLLLAKQQMQRKLDGRRRSSKLPKLIELVLSRPMVSAGMIAEVLDVTPQGALKIAGELNLRELTGRGRFRAWGIV